MRKAWIGAALAPTLALLACPLWAQQRTSTTVVACSGTFAKDSSHLELTTAFNSKNVTFADVEAADGTKVPASILFPTIRSVGSKCGGPIQPTVAIFI